MSAGIFVIAGLGNPGDKYDGTRHNTGFRVIDLLSEKWGIPADSRKHDALCGRGVVNGVKVMLMKPQTFMNLSGKAVASAVNFHKADPSGELIVVYDDVDLPAGKLRIREGGSAGGHNGMKDIIAALGTESFTRVRIGVGARPDEWDLADWVLSRPSAEDEEAISAACRRAADAVEAVISHDAGYAMSRYNG